MAKKLKKLVFVLPEYDKNLTLHYTYLVDLLEKVAEEMEVCVFVEYGKCRPKFKNIQHCYVEKFQIKGLNLVERFFVFLWLRLKGYKRFYVHYSYFSAILAGLITRIFGGKSFVWNCEHKKLYRGGTLPFKVAIKLIHKIVTCTKLMAGYYHEFFKISKKRLEVMHNWVDVRKVRDFEKKDMGWGKNTILFVHWLSPRKGSEYLPGIIEHVFKEKSDCNFIIVGEGPDEKKLRDQFKNEDRVKLTGAVPNREIINYYKNADVFIMPSREEEFGRVLIEAMASGTPIVAMDTFGVKYILNDEQKRFVSEQENVFDFSRKIIELLSDEGLRKHMSEVGLKRAKDFDEHLSLKRFLEIVS